MKTEQAFKLVKGDKVLLGPRKVLGVVEANVESYNIVNGKTRHMHVIKITTKRKGKKDVLIEEYCDWRQPFELFVPKPKPKRKAVINWIAKWFGMTKEVKVA